ncbi:hypothetical protein BDQ12DRAFT_649955 [Crucibulum laeve]|uniref:Short-chain dehydrogenase n=1 Tax=Crucibulum laeve TaxID=68775 RepID=A0A5C3M512_9AGAR|nr:hypothetical protein BDQ12DRAFT_649955 [Crucibulum laeve]
MKRPITAFLRDQWQKAPPALSANLKGKTVVVVGANSGLGFEATKHFARMNPGRLILACRSQQRGDAAVERIKIETGYNSAAVWLVDLNKFASVKAFADKFENEGGRLDLLIENAGTLPNTDYLPHLTGDGWEEALQINHLGLSLLGLRLIPRLLQTAQEHSTTPRLVLVTSDLHYMSSFEKRVTDSPNPLRLFGSKEYCTTSILRSRYRDSKLLNVFFVRALQERLGDKPLIVNCVNPGYCYSGLRSSFSGLRALLDRLVELLLARSTEEGSRQLIWGALGEDPQIRGAYISMSEVNEPSDYVIAEEGKKIQDKLWDDLIKELSVVDPAVKNIVDNLST